MIGCRGPAGAHAALVNYVQSADAEDPWMQREWAATMTSEGRGTEAVMHLQVLLIHPVQHCSGTQGSGPSGAGAERLKHSFRCCSMLLCSTALEHRVSPTGFPALQGQGRRGWVACSGTAHPSCAALHWTTWYRPPRAGAERLAHSFRYCSPILCSTALESQGSGLQGKSREAGTQLQVRWLLPGGPA